MAAPISSTRLVEPSVPAPIPALVALNRQERRKRKHRQVQRRWIAAGLCACAIGGLAALTPPTSTASATVPSGTGLVLNAPVVGVAATPDGRGYWETTADGGIFAFGDAKFAGSTGSIQLRRPVVATMSTTDGRGYWEVASDGGIFAFGDAAFHGSTGSIPLSAPIVGMAATKDSGGYWEVASDGGVFAFGDARFYGSASGMSPNSPIIGIAPTHDGRGYWEAAADGSVYSFGDARFAGSAPLGKPIVGIGARGNGYRLAASDGGVFAFGGAGFFGSTGGHPLNAPVIGIATTPGGYLTVGADGGVFAFGSTGFYGSLSGSTVRPAMVSVAVVSNDSVTPTQVALWDRVNMCEEGGRWNVEGSMFSGGLGFSHANWARFNTFGFPSDAAQATPDQQIRVAVAFAEAYWGSPDAAPDQNGCAGY